jgi:hypothetical protein
VYCGLYMNSVTIGVKWQFEIFIVLVVYYSFIHEQCINCDYT